MAEFVEVTRQKARMCEAYGDDHCEGCPLESYNDCMIPMEGGEKVYETSRRRSMREKQRARDKEDKEADAFDKMMRSNRNDYAGKNL